MSIKPRLSVSLTEPQMAYLKGEAIRRGVSVSELLREILHRVCEYGIRVANGALPEGK